ncbi:MAG: hypothetical protein CL570_00365 [Alphaproteobacteria bacterium]|nr:hypothetical protein [Alphaproteobacteria bacterium]|tara:strand:- start:5387 stop:5938 length:552 start_codon:yes stop_codon:yes gene_type:complete
MATKPDDLTYPVIVSLIQELINKFNHYDEYKDKIYKNRISKEKRLERALLAIFGNNYIKSKPGRKAYDEDDFIEELYQEFVSEKTSRLSIIKKHLHKAQRLNKDVDEQNIIDRLDDKLKARIETKKAQEDLWSLGFIEDSNKHLDEYMEEEAYDEVSHLKEWLKANEKHILKVLGHEGLIKEK